MLDYADVKRWKRELMLADPEFLTGRGRLESVEFHVAERIYRKGIEDGGLCLKKIEQAIEAWELVGDEKPVALLQEIRSLLKFE